MAKTGGNSGKGARRERKDLATGAKASREENLPPTDADTRRSDPEISLPRPSEGPAEESVYLKKLKEINDPDSEARKETNAKIELGPAASLAPAVLKIKDYVNGLPQSSDRDEIEKSLTQLKASLRGGAGSKPPGSPYSTKDEGSHAAGEAPSAGGMQAPSRDKAAIDTADIISKRPGHESRLTVQLGKIWQLLGLPDQLQNRLLTEEAKTELAVSQTEVDLTALLESLPTRVQKEKPESLAPETLTGFSKTKFATTGDLCNEDNVNLHKPTNKEPPVPLPEQIKELLSEIKQVPESQRREAIVKLLTEISQQSASLLETSKSPVEANDQSISPLVCAVVEAMPENYEERLQLLDATTGAARNEAVQRMMSVFDAYLATHEPREDSNIKDPIERRQDLIRQKHDLVEEMSDVFSKLRLKLCCPSGQPGNLRLLVDQSNPKGQFRLIPRGTGQAEVTRARMRDLLPSLRFEDVDASLKVSDSETVTSPSSKGRDKRR